MHWHVLHIRAQHTWRIYCQTGCLQDFWCGAYNRSLRVGITKQYKILGKSFRHHGQINHGLLTWSIPQPTHNQLHARSIITTQIDNPSSGNERGTLGLQVYPIFFILWNWNWIGDVVVVSAIVIIWKKIILRFKVLESKTYVEGVSSISLSLLPHPPTIPLILLITVSKITLNGYPGDWWEQDLLQIDMYVVNIQ